VRLAHVIGTLDPAWGGPVTVLTHLSCASRELGVEVEVVTLDSGEEEWLTGVPEWVHAVGPALGRYRFAPRLPRWLHTNLPRFDAVVVHGVWQYQSLATRAAARKRHVPYALCVHGALAPWLNLRYRRKHVKKQVYWLAAEHRVLRDASAVLFACEEERRKARDAFWPYDACEYVVPFAVEGPKGDRDRLRKTFVGAHRELAGRRVLLFLGRLHPVKGCDLLIQAFASVRQRDSGLHLVMAGPDEVGWQPSLVALARGIGVEDHITWTGMLSNEDKWGALLAADVVVLPSHSESFGIVAVEALSCGVPVLVTHGVGIWRELVAAGAGMAEADTTEGVQRLLDRWLDQNSAATDQMRARAEACFASEFEAHAAARTFLDVVGESVAAWSGEAARGWKGRRP
jgi:glycosyltransferase involved in cell wall biosynthesis